MSNEQYKQNQHVIKVHRVRVHPQAGSPSDINDTGFFVQLDGVLRKGLAAPTLSISGEFSKHPAASMLRLDMPPRKVVSAESVRYFLKHIFLRVFGVLELHRFGEHTLTPSENSQRKGVRCTHVGRFQVC